jgi:alkanesulfonate monooxygenase SsuD/methylene tetrahydromethanopterin reductase-like flavin-dependent oxidoreductase (luciferase family)
VDEKFETLERGLEVCIVGSAGEVAERLAAYAEAGAGHVELKFIAHELGHVREMAARVAEVTGLARGGAGSAAPVAEEVSTPAAAGTAARQ